MKNGVFLLYIKLMSSTGKQSVKNMYEINKSSIIIQLNMMNVLELDEQINRLTRFLFQTLLVEVKKYEPRHSISYKITKRPAKTPISLRIHTV